MHAKKRGHYILPSITSQRYSGLFSLEHPLFCLLLRIKSTSGEIYFTRIFKGASDMLITRRRVWLILLCRRNDYIHCEPTAMSNAYKQNQFAWFRENHQKKKNKREKGVGRDSNGVIYDRAIISIMQCCATERWIIRTSAGRKKNPCLSHAVNGLACWPFGESTLFHCAASRTVELRLL